MAGRLGVGLKRIGSLLKKGNLSVQEFASASQLFGQTGPSDNPRSKGLPKEIRLAFGTIRGVLERFEKQISAQEGVGTEAKKFIRGAVAKLPR